LLRFMRLVWRLQYTWDKALEKVLKTGQSVLTADGKKPTIQTPDEYCRRFRAAMRTYFTCVPSDDADPPMGLSVDLGYRPT
jgi:hypothetical protein